jgi:hypothetical protein
VEITALTLYLIHFCECENLYVWVPADLDQFRRENSHRAVVGGKGLVQLGHVPADTGTFLNQVNLKPGSGKVQRGLDSADPSADNHYVSKILALKAVGKQLHIFHWQYVVSQFVSPFLSCQFAAISLQSARFEYGPTDS